MKKSLIAACVASLGLLAAPAWAADAKASAPAAKASTAQQNKMGECNKQAGDKKGDERKAFMKTCLSAKPATQQDKMKACNKSAEGKKGDERKAYMKECLSK
ncbi:MAG TPA: PsiF family protein [Rubrivivax sp.]|jgi:hypothetical protein|nr:PsiF family protein [Rubrivivax sp.]